MIKAWGMGGDANIFSEIMPWRILGGTILFN